MPWGAVVGAGIGLIGASMQSSASSDAAAAQSQSAANSTAEQRREFDLQQSYYAPQRNLGYGADAMLAQLFGIPNPNGGGGGAGGQQPLSYSAWAQQQGGGGGGGNIDFQGGPGGAGMRAFGPGGRGLDVGTGTSQADYAKYKAGFGAGGGTGTGGAPDYSGFLNSPGYQFSRDQGEQAIRRQASANGSLYSTNTMMGLDQFASNTASTHYNDYVQQLMGLAGLGGQASAGSAAASQNAGNNISANMLSQGNANASGILGSSGAWQSALNNIGGMARGSNMPWSTADNGISNWANHSINNTVSNPSYIPNIPTTSPDLSF